MRRGHLSTITIGWVVVATCADLFIDRFGFGVELPLSKWLVAIGAGPCSATCCGRSTSPGERFSCRD